MEHPECTIHNTKTAKVLNGRKIVIFCPECAKTNMDKVLKVEREIKSSEALTKIDQGKKVAFSEIWKGFILSVYLLLIPFLLALFFPYSQSNLYTHRLVYIYRTYVFHPIGLLLIGSFFLLGLYYIGQAVKSIYSLKYEKMKIVESPKELAQILEAFLSPKRMGILKEFIVRLRKRFEKIYVEDKNMSQMSFREMQVFSLKSLKKFGFENFEINNHYDSEAFGVQFIAENNLGKNAISIVKDEIVISMDDIHRIAIGKAYFDCEAGILITTSKLTEDAKILADRFSINVWNQEKMNDLLKKYTSEQWQSFIENYYDYSDTDLDKYTNFEIQRLQRT